MEYLTLVTQQQTWRLYAGIGCATAMISERSDGISLQELSAAQEPFVWVCSQATEASPSIIQRVELPSLRSEGIAWRGGRINALACTADGRRVVVLEMPADIGLQPRLWLWDELDWQPIDTPVTADISSKLAWLDGSRVVFEATDRHLTILDLDSGVIESGPIGSGPAAARGIREWYAISGGQVLRFPFKQSFSQPPTLVAGFDFGEVNGLRVSDDGKVFTWLEPQLGYQSKGYIQQFGWNRMRFRPLEKGISTVLGRFSDD